MESKVFNASSNYNLVSENDSQMKINHSMSPLMILPPDDKTPKQNPKNQPSGLSRKVYNTSYNNEEYEDADEEDEGVIKIKINKNKQILDHLAKFTKDFSKAMEKKDGSLLYYDFNGSKSSLCSHRESRQGRSLISRQSR